MLAATSLRQPWMCCTSRRPCCQAVTALLQRTTTSSPGEGACAQMCASCWLLLAPSHVKPAAAKQHG